MSDRDSRPWWDALGRGELVLQRCDACDAWRWPPRAACNRCGSFATRWEQISGRGTVASWIVNRHTFGGAVPAPSVVLMVRIDEQSDVLLPGAFDGDPEGRDLVLGADVEVTVDVAAPSDEAEVAPRLRWKLAGAP
jgi:uncharacterized OB-fold protein